MIPDTTGVNQATTITGIVFPPPGCIFNLTLTFTKPDGTTDVKLLPTQSVEETIATFKYVPDQIRDWTVTLDWEGDARALM